jgi:glycosyltransferase involved in cell wall biosynthesis
MKGYGFDVVLLSSQNNELYKRAVSAGLRAIPVTIGNLSFLNPLRIRSLKRIFKSEQPDIVILNLSSDVKAAGIAAKSAGVKNIIYRRGNAKPVKNSFSNRILFKKIITGIIANSEETKRSILKQNPKLFPSDRIKVLYNGIDLKNYDSLASVPIYKNRDSRILLGSAGRLSIEKGHHMLIEMSLLLRKRGIPFILLIAGEGPEKNQLMEKCRKSGLEDEILFTGFIENIKSFMHSIDIFILPSLWEGFGYVSIEAMASSKPVLAFHTGSNPEIIEDKKTGFLVTCYDIEELTDKLSVLINDHELRKTFGNEGRKRVEMFFNSEITKKTTKQYLESLVKETVLKSPVI